jgi:hypothetical protein
MKDKKERMDDIKKLKLKKEEIEKEIEKLEKYEQEREDRKIAKWDNLTIEEQILKAIEMKEDIEFEKKLMRQKEHDEMLKRYRHEKSTQSYYPYPRLNMTEQEKSDYLCDHDL